MNEMLEQSINQFTEELASSSAVPGGGCASALAAAIGVALGVMVGGLTVDKEKYADVADELKELMVEAQYLRVRLLDCVEKDAEMFAPLAKAYGIPKDDPHRDEVMEKCLRDAALAPLQTFDFCCKAIDMQKKFAEKGGSLIISDAATGLALCCGAMYGAAMNVKVNTKIMKDREYAERLNAYIDMGLEKYLKVVEESFRGVYDRYC